MVSPYLNNEHLVIVLFIMAECEICNILLWIFF